MCDEESYFMKNGRWATYKWDDIIYPIS